MLQRYRLRDTVLNHIKQNKGLYTLILIFFGIGVGIGAFTFITLDDIQKQELVKYLQNFFQVLTGNNVDSVAILQQSIKNNLQSWIVIWITGITIIGIPVTLILIGVRGFIIGFTVGSFVDGLGMKGIIFTLLAIVPQNIIIIPCFIVMGVASISFSLMIIKNKLARRVTMGFWQKFTYYSLFTIVLFLISILGCLIESYITPDKFLTVYNNISFDLYIYYKYIMYICGKYAQYITTNIKLMASY